MSEEKNVFGQPLESCCFSPQTGFMRDGYCHVPDQDIGLHSVCVEVTDEFLQYSLSKGNDLITPIEAFDFPGLKTGDKWCLCAARFLEAHQAGVAPSVFLAATNEKTLKVVPLDVLKQYAIDLS